MTERITRSQRVEDETVNGIVFKIKRSAAVDSELNEITDRKVEQVSMILDIINLHGVQTEVDFNNRQSLTAFRDLIQRAIDETEGEDYG